MLKTDQIIQIYAYIPLIPLLITIQQIQIQIEGGLSSQASERD